MENSLISLSNIIKYNSSVNELEITIPKGLKIKINNTLDICLDGEFNLLSNGGINLLSLFNRINLDSYKSQIHLNSLKCKQLSNLNSYSLPIDVNEVKSLNKLIDCRLNHIYKLKELLSSYGT